MSRNKYKRFSRRPEYTLNIPEKANKILNLILIAIIIIVFRIWHIAVIQHEDKIEESLRPQRRTVVEASKRATIRDRFNMPLAINKVSYRATILYSQIRQIPSVRWEKDAEGKKVKKFKRKDHITDLAHILGQELNLDPERLEDLIHAKGSFFGQVPFVIKEDISESEYYRLKMLEKDWAGIHVQKIPKRYYPKGKVASDIIGYMGAINRQEYDKIIHEIKLLEDFIQGSDVNDDLPLPKGIETLAQAHQRLQDLLDHAYTINDSVGKTGIEASFENTLRGYHGKKNYYSDSRGNFLRELPGSKEPIPGQRVLLTISSELQEYAEQLLTQNERIRETRLSKHQSKKTKQPWIKGGAIVALDPQTGEVLALASYPRIDPNDFIPSGNSEQAKQKVANIIRWFESDAYVAEMWEQKRPLQRERYEDLTGSYYDESIPISWDNYLNIVLKPESPIYAAVQKVQTIQKAANIQNAFSQLLEIAQTEDSYWLLKVLYGEDKSNSKNHKLPAGKKIELEQNLAESLQANSLKKELEPYFSTLDLHYDKILLIDLCRLAICEPDFDSKLLAHVGDQTINQHHDATAAYVILKETVQKMTKELFHDQAFVPWRKENEKDFLKEKRAYEKTHNLYPKPYLDYFDKQEQEMFSQFWKEHQHFLIYTLLTGKLTTPSLLDQPYYNHFITWHKELSQGAHASLSWKESYLKLQSLINNLSPDIGIQYLQTFRGFNNLTRPLYGNYRYLRKEDGKQLEKHLAAAFYPARGYGYGRSQAFRQSATQGSIFKLVTSYEALKQRFKSYGSKTVTPDLLNPFTMQDQVFKKGKENFVGYHQDGRPIPVFYNGGRLLKSANRNLGSIDLIKAIENSSNPYFSILASEFLESPDDLTLATQDFSFGKPTGLSIPGEISGKVPTDLSFNKTGLYAMANGQHTLVVTPIQTSVMLASIANGGKVFKPNIISMIAGKSATKIDSSIETTPFISSQLVKKFPVSIKKELFMPNLIRNYLLTGMRKVVQKQLADGLASLSRFYKEYPGAIADYLDIQDQVVGKTSTSESMENIDLDYYGGTNLYTHVWFGGITFDKDIPNNTHTLLYRDHWGNPELVIVVYLKYGAWGKESAPIGAQMIKKWREVKQKSSKKA